MTQSPIREFWGWFAENEDGFHDMIDEAVRQGEAYTALAPLVTAVNDQLRAIHSSLGAELGIQKTPTALIITANGVREAFPWVRRVVMVAPPLRHFRPVAFRRRLSAEVVQELKNIVVKGTQAMNGIPDFYFNCEPIGGDQVHVTVYSPEFRPGAQPPSQLVGAAIVLMEHLLGEYEAAMRIGDNIAFKPMPAPFTPEHSRIRPLIHLPDAVDELFA